MRKSTEKIVQMVQRQYFFEDIDCLTDGRQVKGHSKLSNLSPVLIEGTIRVGGGGEEYDTHRFPLMPSTRLFLQEIILFPPSLCVTTTSFWAMLVASTYSPICVKDFGCYKRELWFVKFCESVSAAVGEMELPCNN